MRRGEKGLYISKKWEFVEEAFCFCCAIERLCALMIFSLGNWDFFQIITSKLSRKFNSWSCLSLNLHFFSVSHSLTHPIYAHCSPLPCCTVLHCTGRVVHLYGALIARSYAMHVRVRLLRPP
jgi:hypothetical protein